ncbi:MAG: hypothetical protein ACFFDF_19215 [Candidatus Odinarchaeota archaeon]
MKLEEIAKMEVGGNFLRFDNGFEFTYQIVNFEPEEVEKEYLGKKSSTKFQWKILFYYYRKAPFLPRQIQLCW